MIKQETLIEPILELQKFAQDNGYYGMMEGLKIVLETYINETGFDENEKIGALNFLLNSENNDAVTH